MKWWLLYMETKLLWFISTLMNSQGSYGYWLWTWHCDQRRQSLLLCHFIDLGTRSFNQQMFSLCTLNKSKKNQTSNDFIPSSLILCVAFQCVLYSFFHRFIDDICFWPKNSSMLLTLTVSYIPLYLITIMIFIFLPSEFISMHFLLLIK